MLPSKPKRRPRYKGTHPRKFHEKYKELNPDKYSKDIEKIIDRGATPAGTHRPICVEEILKILKPKPGETILDATLGYGGHAQVLLPKILPGGRLIGIDQDPIERPRTEARLRALGVSKSNLLIGDLNFRDARGFLLQNGIEAVEMILADLGVSSMQIDDFTRGFSFKHDAPFDLRMNPQKGEPAFRLLERLSKKALTNALYENADESRAEPIAAALKKAKPRTTIEVAGVIRDLMKTFSPRIQKEEGDTPIRRVFQALRIAVNDEFAALDKFLEDVPGILKPGGRVAILSFHSGEDRRVKKSFQAGFRSGIYGQIAPDIIRPSPQEQHSNPRSRPAKLRWAIRGTCFIFR